MKALCSCPTLTCADQEAREACSNQGPHRCCGVKHVGLLSSLQGLRPSPGSQTHLLDSHTPATSSQREPAPPPCPEWGLPQSQNPLPNLLHSQSTHRRLFSNRMLYFSTSLQRKEHPRKKSGRESSRGQISNSVSAENGSRPQC